MVMRKPILDRVEEGAIVLLLTAMTTITFTQVVLRYLFNSGFIWALEATTTCFAWMVLMGISMGIRLNAHLGVGLVVNLLPPRGRKIVGLLGVAACLLYVGLMFAGGVMFVKRLYLLGTFARDLPAPRWVLALGLPLGFAMIGWRLLDVAIAILAGTRDSVCPMHAHEPVEVRPDGTHAVAAKT
jgi:C4-dicarboxylate transporter DctQ subunit